MRFFLPEGGLKGEATLLARFYKAFSDSQRQTLMTFRLQPANKADIDKLLDAKAYEAMVAAESH